jgi:hypothetical protein
VKASYTIESDAGVVALWDESNSPDLGQRRDKEFATAFRQQAKSGKLFFIQSEAEDAVRYHLDVLVDENAANALNEMFEDANGSFRLELPSGALVLRGIGDSKPSQTEPPLRVPPGTYLLNVKARREFDPKEYKARMIQQHGEADTRYFRFVDRIAAGGCLNSLIVGACWLIFPFTRGYWWVGLLLIVTPWLVHFVLRASPRYRRIEKANHAADRQLPHFILLLKRTSAAQEIPGGWIQNR